MYVCMYVCTYVCMYYVCMYVCMYVCTYVRMYVLCIMYCMHVLSACMYVCMYVLYVCTVCMYICMYCVRMYVRTYVLNLQIPMTEHAGPVQCHCTRPRHKQPYDFNDAGGTEQTGYSQQTPQYERTQDHPDGSESEEGTKWVHAPYFSCLPPLKRAQKDLPGRAGGGGGDTTLRKRNIVPPYPTTLMLIQCCHICHLQRKPKSIPFQGKNFCM